MEEAAHTEIHILVDKYAVREIDLIIPNSELYAVDGMTIDAHMQIAKTAIPGFASGIFISGSKRKVGDDNRIGIYSVKGNAVVLLSLHVDTGKDGRSLGKLNCKLSTLPADIYSVDIAERLACRIVAIVILVGEDDKAVESLTDITAACGREVLLTVAAFFTTVSFDCT